MGYTQPFQVQGPASVRIEFGLERTLCRGSLVTQQKGWEVWRSGRDVHAEAVEEDLTCLALEGFWGWRVWGHVRVSIREGKAPGGVCWKEQCESDRDRKETGYLLLTKKLPFFSKFSEKSEDRTLTEWFWLEQKPLSYFVKLLFFFSFSAKGGKSFSRWMSG